MRKIYTLFVLSLCLFQSKAQTVSIVSNLGTSGSIVVGANRYHILEAVYLDSEIGTNNFTTAGSAIERLNFFLNVEGSPNTISNYSIYMKNVPVTTTTLAAASYSTAGYSLVWTGTFNATPAGTVGVDLTTPFVRTAGTNLQILIQRLDNVLHTGYNFYASVGNTEAGTTAFTSRRYNGNLAPTAATSLSTSTFRPAIQLIHVYPVDAAISDLISPSPISCYNTPQSIQVELLNEGTTDIAPGAANVTLKLGGPNSFSGSQTNTTTIAPGGTELLTFTGININNAGDNLDTAYVTLAGDGTTFNDTLITTTITASTLSTYPIIEDVETSLPVFPYASTILLNQLWTLQTGNYTNTDQTTPLVPRAPGTTFYLFDAYSGANSTGTESRLYSNCIAMPTPLPPNPAPVTTISFWMSHDNLFPTNLDSMYLSVSTDKGATWTRLAGYQRYDAAAATPAWTQYIVDVSAYNGQTVQFGFEGTSQYGNAFGLDDIIINYSGIAPAYLLTLEAKRNGAVNQLNWTTSREINTNRFVVERSLDGRAFVAIGEVVASGNSTSAKGYRFTDISPIKGINYYRLRMIDNDNAYKLSEIKNVKNLGVADMSINPNPVQQTMKLVLDAEKAELATITITDMTGRKMSSTKLNVINGSNIYDVPVSGLSKGTYLVTVQLGGQTLVRRINKL